MPTQKKILIVNDTPAFLPDRLKAMGYICEVDQDSSKKELSKRISEYSGLVMRSRFKVDRAFLSKATKLEFIARFGVGLEHIDVEYAKERNIQVFNSPEGSKNTVGEHTLGLLLGLMNHLNRADAQIRQGKWIREPNRGTEIKGKTIGLLGYGNMGQATAQRLQGFEARVIAYDKYKKNYGNAFAESVSLEELFKNSDILSIHIPYMPENHYFIDKHFLDQFHKPLFIINTARGLVLNTSDLVEKIKSGKVLGAALDVLEYEEQSFSQLDLLTLPAPFQYLIQSERVLLSPHIAGWSYEAKEGHARVLAEKIEKAFGKT